MPKKMLIDATHPEETRVVVVDGNKVDDFDFESINKRQLAGNIYLAKVTRVEPSLQAAFVEYGGNRHGFLAFAEIHPDYYQIPVADREALLAEEAREAEERRASEEEDEGGQKRRRRRRDRNDRKEKVEASDAEPREIAGLEVIDLPEGDEATDDQPAPRGLEIADGDEENAAAEEHAKAGETVMADASAETASPETDDVTATEAAVAESDPTLLSEADENNSDHETSSQGDETADEDEAENGRTLSEAAGLDDDERVVGEVGGEQDRTIGGSRAEDDVAHEGSSADEAAEETEGDSSGAEESVAPSGAPEETPAQAEEMEAVVASVPLAPTSDDVDVEDSVADAAEASAEETTTADNDADRDGADDEESDRKGGRRSRRRRRGRRDRRDADAENDGDDAEDEDASGDEPENVGAEDTLEEAEAARARTRLRRRYKIQDVIKVRQIMLVQVVKEERGNKGAALTTYLSLAGRYCVLMPNTARGGGISRKITNAGDRKRLREIIGGLDVPQGMGLIVRTAGAERTKAEIKRDYEFLIRQWEQIRDLTLKSIAPTLIYEEGSLIKRSIRDIYNKEIDQILVEGDGGYREAKEYMKMLMPSHAKNVQRYDDAIPLFSRYQVESYLNGMFNPTVQLKSGGYIVIGVTEALVAIDVNSGRATKQGSIEETALQTNLEAADEVARQLRLRDLAGLIVIDFIDMDENRNNRAVEKRMKERLKNDRARIQVGRISAFGLMEMSRQRLRPGMLEATTAMCPACHGTGLIRSDESLCLSILRELEEEGLRNRADELVLRAPVEIANYLINSKRQHLMQVEERQGVSIAVMADPSLMSPHFEIERSKSQKPRPQRQVDVVTAASVVEDEDLIEGNAEVEVESPSDDDEARTRKRRGRRGGRRRRDDQTDTDQDEGQPTGAEENDRTEASEDEERPKGRRRGRRRGGRNRRGGDRERNEAPTEASETTEAVEVTKPSADAAAAEDIASPEPKDGEVPVVASEPAETELSDTVTSGAEEAAREPEGAVERGDPFETAVQAISTAGSSAGTDDVLEAASATEASDEDARAGEVEVETSEPDTDETEGEPPAAETAEAEPVAEEQPKRRGWWSFNR